MLSLDDGYLAILRHGTGMLGMFTSAGATAMKYIEAPLQGSCNNPKPAFASQAFVKTAALAKQCCYYLSNNPTH